MSYLDVYKSLADMWKKDPHKTKVINEIFNVEKVGWMNTTKTTVNVNFKSMLIKDKVQCFVMSLQVIDNKWYMCDTHNTIELIDIYGSDFVRYIDRLYYEYSSELLEKEIQE